jgi:hypothetical protein
MKSSSAKNPSLPSGQVEFAAQRHPRPIPLHQVEHHMAQDGEVVDAVIVAISRLVLVQEGVENRVKPVFDTPMRTSDLTRGFGRQRSAEQVICGLGGRCACRVSSGADALLLLPPDRLSMTFLDRSHLGADQAGASLENARKGRVECLSPLR